MRVLLPVDSEWYEWRPALSSRWIHVGYDYVIDFCCIYYRLSLRVGGITSPKVGLKRPVLLTYRMSGATAFELESKKGMDKALRLRVFVRI
jgi:hypothetical protein